jgi:hypothetical protein
LALLAIKSWQGFFLHNKLEGRSLAPGLNLDFFKIKFSPHPTLAGYLFPNKPRNAPTFTKKSHPKKVSLFQVAFAVWQFTKLLKINRIKLYIPCKSVFHLLHPLKNSFVEEARYLR